MNDEKRRLRLRAQILLLDAHILRDKMTILCGDMERHDAEAYSGLASDMLTDFRTALFDIQQAIDALSLHVEV